MLGFTNPSKQKDVSWAKDKLIEINNNNINDNTTDNIVGALISVIAPSIINGATSTNNLMIFSIFESHYDNKEYIVLGIAGRFIPLHEYRESTKKENALSFSKLFQQPIIYENKKDLKANGFQVKASKFQPNDIVGYKKYVNGRFGFSILYPQNFIANRTPVNGDGLSFTSPDGAAILVASGSNNTTFNLKEIYDMSIKNVKGELGYTDMGDNWYVVKGKIDYTDGGADVFLDFKRPTPDSFCNLMDFSRQATV